MLLVKTFLEKSRIHGIGLFAAEFIPKGAVIWKFADGFDLKLDKNDLSTLSEAAYEQTIRYGYLSKNSRKFIIPSDDSRFFNHSDNPNVGVVFPDESAEEVCVALQDINAGEELTQNYQDFDIEFESYSKDLQVK